MWVAACALPRKKLQRHKEKVELQNHLKKRKSDFWFVYVDIKIAGMLYCKEMFVSYALARCLKQIIYISICPTGTEDSDEHD